MKVLLVENFQIICRLLLLLLLCYYCSLFLQEYEGVTVATSKTEGGFVQVVLTDQENGINIVVIFENISCSLQILLIISFLLPLWASNLDF